MKTKIENLVNPHLLLVSFLGVFMVLCPGKNQAYAQASRETREQTFASSSQVKSQLHIPWNLLSERLRAVANAKASDGSVQDFPIENRLILVPYEGEAINWTLRSGHVTPKVSISTATINANAARITIPASDIQIVLDQIEVDQVIEREIGGVVVRVHLQANCGPIQIRQPAALADSTFNLSWANGSPVATLGSLNLSWAPNTWTFSPFECRGPSGLDTLIRDGVAKFLSEPSSLKPYVESAISENLKSSVDSVLAKLREPLTAGSAKEPVVMRVGSLAPVATGIIADLTVGTDAKSAPLPAAPLPSATVLNTLSTSDPSLVGDLSLIQFVVDTKLKSAPAYYRFDLQTVDSFHSLMHSRIKQLFVWKQLWKFPEDNPFPFTIFKPKALKLSRGSGSTLTSTVPVQSLIQAYRDKAWYSFVEASGSADTNVTLSVSGGAMKYSTSIQSLKLKAQYSAAYSKRFDVDQDKKLPVSIVEKAMTGARPELSGSVVFPIVDLESGGRYRASSLTWLSKSTFALRFTQLK